MMLNLMTVKKQKQKKEKDVHVPDKISVHQAWRRQSLDNKLDRFTAITVIFSIL